MSFSTFSVLFLLVAAASPKPMASQRNGTSIVAAGREFDVSLPVILWNDEQGFNGYQEQCIDERGGCCSQASKRYGIRKGLHQPSLEDLQAIVSQLVLHFDGCVNSRSCFKSMHNRPRAGGCGLSSHFMIDSDGTIYQTLDLAERAYHAEQENSISIGIEICNRGRYNPEELSRLPAEYATRPRRDVVINGFKYNAYDFRPEQYEAVIALTRTLLRIFPKMKPEIPRLNGEVYLNTLDDPLSFSGIVGHLHVDLQKRKWDPGALDWNQLQRALSGFYFPIQLGGFLEIPANHDDLIAARRTAYYASEERVTGHFPISSARLWHSGVHLRGRAGSPVFAPARGRLLAVRNGTQDGSSTSFALIRHEINVGGTYFRFYSLLAHLSFPPLGPQNLIPWMRAYFRPENATAKRDFNSGKIVLLDERVETGDRLGFLGHVRRGPEIGSELHVEVLAAEKLPRELERFFRVLNAGGDGSIVRRKPIVRIFDKNNDAQINHDEIRTVFHGPDSSGKLSLRRLAIRHQHEWGSKNTEAEFIAAREFSGVPLAERKQLYQLSIAPYVFWTDELSAHAALPGSQVITSYHPITFWLTLAALASRIPLNWPGDLLSDESLEPRLLPMVPILEWTHPPVPPDISLRLPALIGSDLKLKRRDEIPLIELPPTDHR